MLYFKVQFFFFFFWEYNIQNVANGPFLDYIYNIIYIFYVLYKLACKCMYTFKIKHNFYYKNINN